MKVSEVLESYDTGISEDVIAAMLAQALLTASLRRAVGLTERDRQFLDAYSGVEASDGSETPGEVRTALTSASSAYDTAKLAKFWGITPSRVRHRVAEGSLYALRVGRSLLFPRWQFDPDVRPLPHLATLLEALPKDLHPAEVAGWMTTANGNLIVGDQPTSVRDWLLSGGPVAPVVELAQSIDRW